MAIGFSRRVVRQSLPAALLIVGIAANLAWCCVALGQAAERAARREPTGAVARMASWKLHLQLAKASPYESLEWRCIGPRLQGGRIETIACDPRKSSTMYVGVGSGGLWKTVNNGITWKPIFDQQPTCAMGDVAVAPSDPNVLWLGTGEVLMARSALAGIGVFKSTDAGASWTNMGLQDTHHIGRVVIDPLDADTVYVAAIGHRSSRNEQRGVFKTTNGGRTWQRVLFLDDRTSAIDLVMDPSNRQVLYATTWQRDVAGQEHAGVNSGIHKTGDGGKTWTRLSGGLPEGDKIGRIGIDVAASQPQVVYALIDQGEKDSLYRSSDGGAHWKQVNRDPLQARWDWCEVRVAPDNENEVYSIGQKSFVSRDGGVTFAEIGGTIVHLLPHGARTLHLDTHAMWINPADTDHVVFGNDGGLFVSYDRCENWLHLNNLPIAECYAVTFDRSEPYNIYVGTQDNAALFGPSTQVMEDGAPDRWQHVYLDPWGGGDSYYTYRDPTDDATIYYEHQYGALRRKNMRTRKTVNIQPKSTEKDTPLRNAWMTPFFPSQHAPATLYYGAQCVLKSTDRGGHWARISPDLTLGVQPPNVRYKAITTLAESPREPGLLYAGTDSGNVYVTRDDGEKWTQIDKGLPRCDVARLAASPHSAASVFVALSGMGSDDFSPLVFRSDDQGTTWRSISNGLPMEPVHVIAEDPIVANLLYLGTDLGVYVSRDGGDRWHSLNNHLPPVSVYDLFAHPREQELVIGTHGRSVFVLDLSSLRMPE